MLSNCSYCSEQSQLYNTVIYWPSLELRVTPESFYISPSRQFEIGFETLLNLEIIFANVHDLS